MSLVRFPLQSNKAPAVPKGTAWQDYTGEVNTPLIGIMIPKGVYLIDIDTYKGVSTDDVEQALGCSLDWDNAELQETLNGGHHYGFKCSQDLMQGSNLLGVKGFDTRSAGKGYIATGEGYDDVTVLGIEEALAYPEGLPELPPEAIKRLSAGPKQELILAGDNEDDGLMSAVLSQGLEMTYDEMQAYLDLLDDRFVIDQDEWYKKGMAIWHETQGSEEGYQLFDTFSRRSPDNYNESKNRSRWESFGNKSGTNPITFASVIHDAGGAIAKAQVVVKTTEKRISSADSIDLINEEMHKIANTKMSNLSLDNLLKKVQERMEAITKNRPAIASLKKDLKAMRDNKASGDYADDYVFATLSGEYINRYTKAAMGPRAFDVKHSRHTPMNGEGEQQPATRYVNDRIEVVDSLLYHPKAYRVFGDSAFEHDGISYLNAYVPVPLKRVTQGTTNIVERIKGHIAHLLVDPIEQQILINYLAHNVQYPGEKIPWAIVLQGVQGDGKSLLAEMMQIVLGIRNVRIMNVQTLESPFTGWATGQCMTFIEELKMDNYRKYEVLNNLKPYISNPIVEEVKKGKDPRTVLNTTNYIALTNFKDALPIDDNDRRYAILFSQWQSKIKLQEFMENNKNYYPSIYEAMRGNGGELLDWLMTHEIPQTFKDTSRAPDTNAKKQMQMLSKSPAREALEDALDQFGDQVMEGDELDITKLTNLVAGEQNNSIGGGPYEEFPKTRQLRNVLMDMGYEQKGRRRPASGEINKHTFYGKS